MKAKIDVKKIGAISLILVLMAAVGGIIYWVWKTQMTDGPPVSQSIPIRIRYGFTIYNQTNKLVENAVFFAFAPVKASSAQECKAIEASHPFENREDSSGNQLLLFKLEKMPPYGSRIITITADVTLFKAPNKQFLQTKTQFLQPEINIAPDHPEIMKIAKSLDTGDIEKTAHNIFQWVSDHIQYERSSGSSKGAVHALVHRKGDCTEYADLFTSLCRAVNISARSMGGYVCPQNAVLKPGAYHNWSEFYYKGRWHIADPQKKQFPQGNTEYIATKIIQTNKDSAKPSFDKFWISDPALRAKMN